MSPRDGLDGSPESLPEMYPHAWIQAVCAHVVVIPCMMFLQSLCSTPSPGRGPTHRAVPRERINLHLGSQGHSSSWAFLPMPSTIAFQPSWWPFLIWREEQCSAS